jgi:hypothetical protein
MNARAPLDIRGFNDSCENVHPDVLFVPEGFAGYSYWMVFTPYPSHNDRFENPTLRASHDGLTWMRIAGIPDPLVPPPEDFEEHHADPDLVLHGGQLHVVYTTWHRGYITFSVVSSEDTINWSEPLVFHREIGGVSPACLVDRGVWHLWFVRVDPSKISCRLFHRAGPDLITLRDERLCRLSIPAHLPWHIDVCKVENGYEALIAAFPEGTDETRTRLFHAFSHDGISFVLTREGPILEPSTFGWDNRMIYRSSFLKDPDGTYRIWYSAASWALRFGIAQVQGALDSLRESTSGSHARVAPYGARFFDELNGRLRYEARHHLPAPLLSSILKAGIGERSSMKRNRDL